MFRLFLFRSGSSSNISCYNPHYVDVAADVAEKKPAKRSAMEGEQRKQEGVGLRRRRLTTRQRLWAASTWIQSSTKTPWQAGCAVRTGRGRGGGFDSRYEPLNRRTSSLHTATMQSGRSHWETYFWRLPVASTRYCVKRWITHSFSALCSGSVSGFCRLFYHQGVSPSEFMVHEGFLKAASTTQWPFGVLRAAVLTVSPNLEPVVQLAWFSPALCSPRYKKDSPQVRLVYVITVSVWIQKISRTRRTLVPGVIRLYFIVSRRMVPLQLTQWGVELVWPGKGMYS